MQGHATDAWDFLSSQKFSTAASEAQRLAVMASIRMDSWSEVCYYCKFFNSRMTRSCTVEWCEGCCWLLASSCSNFCMHDVIIINPDPPSLSLCATGYARSSRFGNLISRSHPAAAQTSGAVAGLGAREAVGSRGSMMRSCLSKADGW